MVVVEVLVQQEPQLQPVALVVVELVVVRQHQVPVEREIHLVNLLPVVMALLP
jgi:hypothetical protein